VRISFANRASPSLERLGPWSASAGHGSQVLGEPKNSPKDQRNRHRLVPARSGARAPLACEDRRLVRVCPCVVFRLQKSASVALAQRSAYPVATERVDGSKGRASPKGHARSQRRRQPASRWQSCAAVEDRSRALERASRGKGPCRMEGISAVLPHAPLHAVERDAVLAALGHGTRRASDAGPGREPRPRMSEARPHTSREEDNASRDEHSADTVRSAEANPTWREPGDSPGKTGSGAHEARVLVRRSEKAEVGPTHRASLPHDEPQGKSAARRWPRGAPHGVLTHAAGVSLGVRTVENL